MTALVVVLIVLAVLGWSLAIALLIGRSIALADRVDLADYRRLADHTDRLISGAETGHAPFRAQINGLHMARDRCPDCRP